MEEPNLGYGRQRVSPARLVRDRNTHLSHSFKLLPNIGLHIVELLEGTLSKELQHAWRWRPGGDALKSRRASHAKDLADMPGWRHGEPGDEAVVDSIAGLSLKAHL